MTKRFFATLRYTTVVALVASVFVFSGCGDDDNGPTVFTGTTLEFLKSDQFKQGPNNDADHSFDSLVMYLAKYPDLEAYLSGTTEYTLFAPSNQAFVNLTALPGLKDPDQVNPAIIKGVLAYHFVAGKKMQADMTAGTSITTMYSSSAGAEAITVNGDGTLLTGSQNKNIVITTADQQTSNGVVHTVATVLIPPSTGGQLSAILGSLGATVLLGKDFTWMAYMIGRADAGITNPAQTYSGMLAGGTNLTLLAIPNAVFVGMAGQVLQKQNPTDAEIKGVIDSFGTGAASGATLILKNHVLPARYTVAAGVSGATQFTNGGTITAAGGKTITVMTGVPSAGCGGCVGVVLTAPKTGSANPSQVPIMRADIDTEAGISNGVLHVVGGVVLP